MVKIKNLFECLCAETLSRRRLTYTECMRDNPLYKCEGMEVEIVLFYTS